MASRSLARPSSPEPISQRRAAQLCRERAALDEERLELGRLADAKRKQIEAIDAELMVFVAANAPAKNRTVTLAKWRLSIVQVAKSIFYKRELEQAIGLEAVEALRREAGTQDKLQVEAIGG